MGLVTTHIEYEHSQSLIEGVEKYSKDTGTDFLIFISKAPEWNNTDYGYQEWYISKFFSKKNIDGLIFPTPTLARFVSMKQVEDYVESLSKKLPVVSVITPVNGVHSVLVDSTTAFKKLVSHIIDDHGRRVPAFMGTASNSQDIWFRYNMFLDVLDEHGIQFNSKNFFKGDYTFSSAVSALSALKCREDVDFDFLVCSTDEMAIGAMDYLKSIGVKVPEDVCVTGFDNIRRASYCVPTLSTIDQDVRVQAYKGAEILAQINEGKDVPFESWVTSTCHFRDSCGCFENDTFDVDKMRIKMQMEANHFDDHHDQMIRLLSFVEELQCNLSLLKLPERLKPYFDSFEIKNCVICLYRDRVFVKQGSESKLPKHARIYYSSDESFSCINNEEYFDCSESILPEKILSTFKGVSYVFVLYHGEYQYGYLVVTPGMFSPSTYRLIFSMLAKIIAHAYEVSENELLNLTLEQSNKKLSLISRTDELTGILNRRGFLFSAQNEIELAINAGKKGLVIFGDIDGLKRINDTFGHDAGDRAILAEVELLKKTFRSADTMGRLGGDEFAILSISLSMEYFANLKRKLASYCDEWNKNTKEMFSISISLGAVEFSYENSNLLDLLKKADSEQYIEKRKKKFSH